MPSSRWSCRSWSWRCLRSWASRAPSGSSSSRTCGLSTRARASATRCCWPPDSCAGRRLPSSPIRASSSASPTRRSIVGLRAVLVAQPEGDVVPTRQEREQRVVLEDGVDRPPVRRVRAPGRRRRAGSGRTSGRSNPAIIRSVVVLPQPEARAARRTRRRGCRGRCRRRRARRRTTWSATTRRSAPPRHQAAPPVSRRAQPGDRGQLPKLATNRSTSSSSCCTDSSHCSTLPQGGRNTPAVVLHQPVQVAPAGRRRRGSRGSCAPARPVKRDAALGPDADDVPRQAVRGDGASKPLARPGAQARRGGRSPASSSTSSRVARAAAIASGLPLKVPTCS